MALLNQKKMKTTLLNLRKDYVYIGRKKNGELGLYGNPFIIGRDGSREEVMKKFREYALDRLRKEPEWLEPLRGKYIGCWCKPEPCHGDVLLELLGEDKQ